MSEKQALMHLTFQRGQGLPGPSVFEKIKNMPRFRVGVLPQNYWFYPLQGTKFLMGIPKSHWKALESAKDQQAKREILRQLAAAEVLNARSKRPSPGQLILVTREGSEFIYHAPAAFIGGGASTQVHPGPKPKKGQMGILRKKAAISYGGAGISLGSEKVPVQLQAGYGNVLGLVPVPDLRIRAGDKKQGVSVGSSGIGLDSGHTPGTHLYYRPGVPGTLLGMKGRDRKLGKQKSEKKAGTPVIEVPRGSHPVKLQKPVKRTGSDSEFPFQGFIDFQGLKIDIENKKGSYREGKDKDGTEWKCKMHHHYGEIRETEGTDGDKLDAYVGPNHDSSLVVVIHQCKPDTGAYDEDKVMLGFNSLEEAVGAYKNQYDKPGFYREGKHTVMPIGQFWRWVHDRKNKGKKVAFLAIPEVSAAHLTPTAKKQLKRMGVKRPDGLDVSELAARLDVDEGTLFRGGTPVYLPRRRGKKVASIRGYLKRADRIPGGLADKKKPSDFPAPALREGRKVELEHTSSPSVATEIAMDHLTEDPKYYKKLKEYVEKKGALGAGTLAKDFGGGVDPFGIWTSRYGQEAERAGLTRGQHRIRHGVTTAGGLIGGATVVPAAVSGAIYGVKGIAGAKGGVAARLAAGGTGFLEGAAKPFKRLHSAAKSRQVLKGIASRGSRSLTTAERLHMEQALGAASVGEVLKNVRASTGQSVTEAVKKTRPRHVLQFEALARRGKVPQGLARQLEAPVGAGLREGAAGLGLSGVIGGTGAAVQYQKGRRSARETLGGASPPATGVKVANMPFLKQDRPEKVKEIYKALKRDHPEMPAEVKARIAARKGKKSPQSRKPPETGGPAHKAPLNYVRKGKRYVKA